MHFYHFQSDPFSIIITSSFKAVVKIFIKHYCYNATGLKRDNYVRHLDRGNRCTLPWQMNHIKFCCFSYAVELFLNAFMLFLLLYKNVLQLTGANQGIEYGIVRRLCKEHPDWIVYGTSK